MDFLIADSSVTPQRIIVDILAREHTSRWDFISAYHSRARLRNISEDLLYLNTSTVKRELIIVSEHAHL